MTFLKKLNDVSAITYNQKWIGIEKANPCGRTGLVSCHRKNSTGVSRRKLPMCRTSRVRAPPGPAPTVLRSTAETCSLRCISDKKPDDNQKNTTFTYATKSLCKKTLYTLCRMYNALRYTIYTIQRRRTLYMVYTHFIMSESHCPQCDCLWLLPV